MKRLFFVLALFFLCICICSYDTVYALELSAKSAIIIDAENGRVLYEKNGYEKMPMASTTKIMTALIALECGNPQDVVTVSKNAAYQEGTSLYLKIGEKIILKDLLYGLMLNSGNDAAVAIAEHISGSTEAFAEKMTQKAREIGAYNTSFKNPNGLDEADHYTTAYDLALISKKALDNTEFSEIVSTKSYTISGDTTRYLSNHNKLLWNFDGCIGVKTGFTKKSGRTLVSAAERDGMRVVAVTLNAPDDWNDHKKMFEYVFGNYKEKAISKVGDVVSELSVKGGVEPSVRAIYTKNFSINLNPDEEKKLEIKTVCPSFLDAPVLVGTKIGESRVMLDGKLIATIPICTADCSLLPKKNNFFKSFVNVLELWVRQCGYKK